MRKSDMFDLAEFADHPVSYLSAGLFTSEEAWKHPSRIISSYELIIVAKGVLEISDENRDYQVQEKEALFLRPGIRHWGRQVTEEKISFYWCHFVFEGDVPPGAAPAHIPLPEAGGCLIFFKQLLHYGNTPEYPPVCCDYLCRLLVMEVLAAQSRTAEQRDPAAALVKGVEEWIRIHYDRPVTLGDVAAHFEYNKDYLSRIFKQQRHMGLKKYIASVKMTKAKEFIISGAYPLKKISEMVGIEDYNLFLKMFKYHEGVTPTQFRQTYTSIHTNKQ